MPPNDQPYTVLIVDDHPGLRAAITETLTLLTNFTVLTAPDGLVGLERSIAMQPDCVLIDVRMPGMDGYQLAQALRGDPQTQHIPLVILTAMAQDKDRFRGLAVGADHYLLKPIEPEQLVRAIESAIHISRDERQRRFTAFAENAADAHMP